EERQWWSRRGGDTGADPISKGACATKHSDQSFRGDQDGATSPRVAGRRRGCGRYELRGANHRGSTRREASRGRGRACAILTKTPTSRDSSEFSRVATGGDHELAQTVFRAQAARSRS